MSFPAASAGSILASFVRIGRIIQMDFAVLVEEPDERKYDSLMLPEKDRWGLIFRSDDPLAEKESIMVPYSMA